MASESVSEVEMFIPIHRLENAEKKLNRLARMGESRGIDFDFTLTKVQDRLTFEEYNRLKDADWESVKPLLQRYGEDAGDLAGENTPESSNLISAWRNRWKSGWRRFVVPSPKGSYEGPVSMISRTGAILRMKYGVLDSDWRVIAVLEPADDAYFTSRETSAYMVNTLPKVEGGEELPIISEVIPENINSFCEHCQTVRRRSELIVVENMKTGEISRVGSTCLQEYTKIDPSFTMKFFSYSEIPTFGDPTMLKRGPSTQDLYEFMEKATRYFNYKDSYIKGIGRSIFDSYVREIDGDYWMIPFGYPKNYVTSSESPFAFQPWVLEKYTKRTSPPSSRTDEMVMMMISYIMELNPRSDFEHNLKRIVRSGVVTSKTAGYAASIYTVYRRAEEKGLIQSVFFPTPPEVSEEDEVSQHMGSVGDRLDFEAQVIRKQVRDGYYGETTMMVFQVVGGEYDGSEVIWWSSSSKRMPSVGDVVSVRGTIKKHGEFRGKKTTTITRAKITE